jgi:hypothetical protein
VLVSSNLTTILHEALVSEVRIAQQHNEADHFKTPIWMEIQLWLVEASWLDA